MNQTERIGRFEVQERLRSNAFAIIYRGRDPFDGRRVQIKFCVAPDESIRHRFLIAAEKAASLRHPNIATVYEFGSGDSKPYLVQEAFSDATLSDLLARREPIEDVLKLYYLMQIARGLQHAHGREVLHGELRPASVMVDRSGEAKLTDFGTARLASAFAQLGNGAHRWPAVGWLLPELILGLELDARSDIYGFGALAYEVLAKRPPYLAESLSSLVPQLLETDPQPVGVYWPECPPELDRLILRCLARDPGRRFGSMDEVLQEFDRIIPVPAAPDIVEQETTLVIAEIPSASFVETDEIEAFVLPVSKERETGEVRRAEALFRSDWRARVDTLRDVVSGLAVRSRSFLGTAGRRLETWFSQWAKGQRSPLRWRIVVAAAGLLVLTGLVGWGVVREADRSLPALPTTALELPRDTLMAAPKGRLLVDSQPWGEVLQIVSENGSAVSLPDSPYTPFAFELEPGRYRVEVVRAGLERSQSCEVTIEAAETARCDLRLAQVEPSDFFKQTGWWQ